MPAAEVILWSKIKGRMLLGCKFRRQYGIDQYTLDFYSPEIKLAVELDGESHYRTGGQDFDRRRDAMIRSFGIRVIRILNDDVYDNLDGVWEFVWREVCARREELGISNHAGRRTRGQTGKTSRRRGEHKVPNATPPAPPC